MIFNLILISFFYYCICIYFNDHNKKNLKQLMTFKRYKMNVSIKRYMNTQVKGKGEKVETTSSSIDSVFIDSIEEVETPSPSSIESINTRSDNSKISFNDFLHNKKNIPKEINMVEVSDTNHEALIREDVNSSNRLSASESESIIRADIRNTLPERDEEVSSISENNSWIKALPEDEFD